VAEAAGDPTTRRQVLDELRAQLADWLTYSGPNDDRYFAYDSRWGGVIGVPAEFGNQNYNDHHLQYGYLIRAAAVMAQADPQFLRQYGATVDLIVRDYAGAGPGDPSLPSDRVFSPYLGHSLASGDAQFADGNNQESSSEAVAAWEAVARWGMVSDQPDLVTLGTTRYAMEAETARDYWLGYQPRPTGYGHQMAGIVWDAKVDFATFFDPRPESVQGIQLLPLTFGALYRADAASASDRAAELARDVGGPPRVWGDLFAADLAAANPEAALADLSTAQSTEPSTSRALVRYFIETLAALGPPDPTVQADAPFGIALRNGSGLHLLGANPSSQPQVVTFHAAGKVVGALNLPPGQSQTTTAP
jgi:endoglucanase Acf2